MACKNAQRTTVGLFFLVMLLIGASLFRDYGISWDEPTQRITGAVTVKYVASILTGGLADGSLEHIPDLKEYRDRDYGVAFEAPAFALEKLLALKDSREIFMFRHLLNFLVFLGGVYAAYRLACRRFRDWRIGLLAASFLVLTPRFFAESFYNSKDIVFMAAFAIAMNAMIEFSIRPDIKTALLYAFATAFAIDVRIMAVIFPVASVAVCLVKASGKESPGPGGVGLTGSYLVATAVLVVAMWPWLWGNPPGRFLQALANMSRFRWHGEVLYMGEFVRSAELPWHYPLVWISITTPLLYLGLFLIGLVSTARQMIGRRFRLWSNDEEFQDVVFLGLFLIPVAAVILLRSVLYDGWRQLYFVYPALLLVAIKGWVVAWNPGGAAMFTRIALGAVTFISVSGSAVWMWRAHPVENVYFNALAGHGLRNRYELDYWGVGNRKALEYILAHDRSPRIHVWADSWTPVEYSFLMLNPDDRNRLKKSMDKAYPSYVLTNYRLARKSGDSKYGRGYELFYQLKVDEEVVLSVYKWTMSAGVAVPVRRHRFGRRRPP